MPSKPTALQSTKSKSFKKEPVWNLERDGLTQSAINTFLTCREHFRLSYKEGWSLTKESDALGFGNGFHFTLAQIHSKHVPTPKSALERYRKTLPKLSGQDHEDRELLLAQVELLAEMYLVYWKKADHEKAWICREEVFKVIHEVELDGVTHLIPITGRFDGVYVNPKTPNHRIHETKTKAMIDQDGIKFSLPLDLQTMLYSLAATTQYHTPIDGVMYDVTRRPGLRRSKTESGEAFLTRIREDVEKRPDWYFMRWETQITPKSLASWVKTQLDPILRDIIRWNKEPQHHHYMNPGALFGKYGSRSDFFDLITRGNRYGLYQRKVPFPELVD